MTDRPPIALAPIEIAALLEQAATRPYGTTELFGAEVVELLLDAHDQATSVSEFLKNLGLDVTLSSAPACSSGSSELWAIIGREPDARAVAEMAASIAGPIRSLQRQVAIQYWHCHPALLIPTLTAWCDEQFGRDAWDFDPNLVGWRLVDEDIVEASMRERHSGKRLHVVLHGGHVSWRDPVACRRSSA